MEICVACFERDIAGALGLHRAVVVRFILDVFAMIGALAFLGCPWRALLRLSGGDLNAILGLAGLTIGIVIGVQILKSDYSLGRSNMTHTAVA